MVMIMVLLMKNNDPEGYDRLQANTEGNESQNERRDECSRQRNEKKTRNRTKTANGRNLNLST
jgi:hypothetical protein